MARKDKDNKKREELKAKERELTAKLIALHDKMQPIKEQLGQLEEEYLKIWKERDRIQRELIKTKFFPLKEPRARQFKEKRDFWQDKAKELVDMLDAGIVTQEEVFQKIQAIIDEGR